MASETLHYLGLGRKGKIPGEKGVGGVSKRTSSWRALASPGLLDIIMTSVFLLITRSLGSKS